jgi:large subunit ribosomal protein L23
MSTAPEAQKPGKAAKADAKAAPKVTAKSKAKAEAAAAEKAAAAAKPAKAPKAPAAKKPAVKKAAGVKRPAHSESRLAQVLIAPIVSEKATMAAEKHNQVLFKVMRDATKPEIKAAVELMFKVTVDSVQTVQHKGKTKKFAKGVGRRDHVKKAYVCLAAGQELNFSGEGA